MLGVPDARVAQALRAQLGDGNAGAGKLSRAVCPGATKARSRSTAGRHGRRSGSSAPASQPRYRPRPDQRPRQRQRNHRGISSGWTGRSVTETSDNCCSRRVRRQGPGNFRNRETRRISVPSVVGDVWIVPLQRLARRPRPASRRRSAGTRQTAAPPSAWTSCRSAAPIGLEYRSPPSPVHAGARGRRGGRHLSGGNRGDGGVRLRTAGNLNETDRDADRREMRCATERDGLAAIQAQELTRAINAGATPEEKQGLLDCLYAVAAARSSSSPTSKNRRSAAACRGHPLVPAPRG